MSGANMKTVLLLIGFILTSIHFAEAQQPAKVHRIGYLDRSTAAGSVPFLDAVRQELIKLGWVEGRNSLSSTDFQRKN